MVKQYPHTLYVFRAGESQQDENGDWVPGGGTFEEVSPCRETVNHSGETIQGADGISFVYGSMIYAPKGISGIETRSRVMVQSGNTVLLDSVVKRISHGQLNTRIWV